MPDRDKDNKPTVETLLDSEPLPPLTHADQPHGARSIVNVLIAINVAVFVLQATLPKVLPPQSVAPYVVMQDQMGRIVMPPPQTSLYWYGVLQTAAVMHGQIWRLFTAQYLHASFLHLLVNMVALHFLGRPLEMMWSRRRFFAIYTACGLAGNVFFTLLGSKGIINPYQAAVGASGCIYGLLGIVAVLFPHAEVLVYYVLPVRIRTAALIMGGIAFMSVIERGSNYGGEACHLAGLAFGLWWALHGDEWWSHSDWAWKRRPS